MATGTQGNDLLTNDPAAAAETIDALGGDDTIEITNRDVQNASTVTVDGGDGVDTLSLTAADYIYALSETSATLVDGLNPPETRSVTLNYSQVERLVVQGMAYTPNGGMASWTTGSTHDEIHVLATLQNAMIVVDSGGGDDWIYFGDVGPFSSAYAGAGNDTIDMSAAAVADTSAWGDDGDDHLIGGIYANYLHGGEGDDVLEGGDGYDVLVGGAGADQLTGGADPDIFRYYSVQESAGASIDSITGFEPGVDRIDLSWLWYLQWIGQAPFDGWGRQVRGTAQGVEADIDGDMIADLIIHLEGGNGGLDLTAADFIWW